MLLFYPGADTFPRHKVCGEFLSPAILPLLRRAGCEAGFLTEYPRVDERWIRRPGEQPWIVADASHRDGELVEIS
jgi:hypothetical protein